MEKFFIINHRKSSKVPVNEIVFMKGEINYTHFYFQYRKRATIAHSLKHFEADLLPRGFLRIHRSYIVNPRFVKSANVANNTLTLVDGTVLRVARRRVKDVELFKF
jgi:DNA-binding LytR/AlgR family response regulator